MNCPCLRPTIVSSTWRDQYGRTRYEFLHEDLAHSWELGISGTWRLSTLSRVVTTRQTVFDQGRA